MSRPAALLACALAACALAACAHAPAPAPGPAPAPAPVVLGGHHDRRTADGDSGFEGGPGASYVVAPGATFDGNRRSGLSAPFAAVTVPGGVFRHNGVGLACVGGAVTVTGGTFAGNAFGGVMADDRPYNLAARPPLPGGALLVTGGTFRRNGRDALRARWVPVTVTGGTFTGNGVGLLAEHTTVLITGGDFRANAVVTRNCVTTIIGGTFRDNTGLPGDGLSDESFPIDQPPPVLTVSGGAFTDNAGYGLGIAGVNARVTLSGGAFARNRLGDVFVGPDATLTLVGRGLRLAGPHAGASSLAAPRGRSVTGAVTGTLRGNAAASRLTFRLGDGARLTLAAAK